jgi:two-component system sensor histidine kinase CpxA
MKCRLSATLLVRRITQITRKEKYGRVEMVGPFSVSDGEDNYQLYLIRPASSSQSDFINLLFDRPLLLLIVTMLVSSPLLLWLAWSLAKPRVS